MKNLIPFLVLSILLFSQCKNKIIEEVECNTPDLSQTDFVYLEDNIFKLKGEPFFPIMLNYIISFRSIENEFIISPSFGYENGTTRAAESKEAIGEILFGHFQLIKELGFNSIRITFDRINCSEDKEYYYGGNGVKYRVGLNNEDIFGGLEEILEIAKANDLRVMLLIKHPIDNEELIKFTEALLERFKDNPTIFAYDFMNEPLYFDSEQGRTKLEALEIAASWKKMMCEHAPNQLFTIAFSEPIEVFKWDASILPVDFVQIHTYHPLRVFSEIYWYSKYINKPFMIGETALPADDDSLSYNEQRLFLDEVYQYCLNAGAIGFGWWNFQDVEEIAYKAQFTGLLNNVGETYTSDSTHKIIGSLKPAALNFTGLDSLTPKELVRPVNYFNMLGYENICITGKILDKNTNKPIEGAVIRGWTEYWSIGMNTYTDENGNFTLYCNAPAKYFAVSAPGMETKDFKKNLDYTNITDTVYDIDNLPNKELEFQTIAYYPFIFNPEQRRTYDGDEPYVFNFDSAKFSRKKFTADLGEIYLNSLF